MNIRALLEHRRSIREALELGRPISHELRQPLVQFVSRALDAERQRLAILQRSNDERHAQIEDAIHRAADLALSERVRQFAPPRAWTGMMWQWLGHRYDAFGLESVPCKRVIRAALKEWTPPTGDTSNVVSNQYRAETST